MLQITQIGIASTYVNSHKKNPVIDEYKNYLLKELHQVFKYSKKPKQKLREGFHSGFLSEIPLAIFTALIFIFITVINASTSESLFPE